MSLSLLSTAVVAIAVYFGMPLIEQGRVEGFLLVFFGFLAAYSVEYVVSKVVSNRMCPECSAWMKKVQGLYYCKNCRRFYELRRAKGV
ncbi:MAG: hypothetical protein QXT82_11795 [Candidatus Caldarchaeum sp.]